MKKLIIAFMLLPLFTKAQCYTLLTGDTTKAFELKEVIEKYTMFKLYKNPSLPITSVSGISFSDSTGFASLMIGMKRKKELIGTEIVYGSPVIFRIYITGPAERIDKMVKEYFAPLIEPCNPKKSPSWYFWNNLKLVYAAADDHEGIAMKFIEIESTKN